MLKLITKSLNKVFGTKSDRDIKDVQPLVKQIVAEYEKLNNISNDELRDITTQLKATIKQGTQDILDTIEAKKLEAEGVEDANLEAKVSLYEEIDQLLKDKDVALEKVLLEILPKAFAVVRETARRFKENTEIIVTASDFDRELATFTAPLKPVKIDGNKAIWSNTWDAAGNSVTWDMLHYEVQLIGGIVLHQGKISEMGTGEGKTLVATLPAYLNAISGEGVHIVTVNDYLSRRDSEWMGPIFEFHGLRVDCIDKHRPNSNERRKAYRADITFGTNNEFGFDYLRDNMAHTQEDLVQRKHHYAMIDEVDSVLIDDARTPLIISGPISRGSNEQMFYDLKPRIERLVEIQRKYVTNCLADAKRLFAEGKMDDAGMPLLRAYRGLPKNKALIKFLSESGVKALLLKTEAYYMQNQSKEMHKVDETLYFTIEEKNNQIDLTDKGIETITANGEDPTFFIMPDIGVELDAIEKLENTEQEKAEKKTALLGEYSLKSERIHILQQLLKAYAMFEKDVEYIIEENKIKIVDEQTGRVLDGRRYSDGLHQALEAKENVKVEAPTQTFATVTLQNYFRMYHKLAGMTGTAETEAGEFWEIYKLDVVVIPTNKPIVRKDQDDLVYKTVREKYNAVIDEIEKLSNAGRPVLVGTTSVEISELLSRMLKMRKIAHNVLNAKMHQKEAEVVGEAGKAGTVTIATNMAGRGTDIKLGPGVKDAGGLAIIGTERHDSRRVDRQLRGRAGRQGDPGSTQFFVTLEDNLMRLFGGERISGYMDKLGHVEGDVIQHSMISKSIERAQKKVEENNFGIRKNLLEYDDVMNSQREVIYKRRKHALFGERIKIDINNMMFEVCENICEVHKANNDYVGFREDCLRMLLIDVSLTETDFASNDSHKLTQKLFEEILMIYKAKSAHLAEMMSPSLKNQYEQVGSQYQNIVIPFATGNTQVQVVTNFKKAYDTGCTSVIDDFEKGVVLSVIDETWKEHLRQMDDLRHNVQNARFEQKDPLLIYKFESYELFKNMLIDSSAQIIGILMQGGIQSQDTGQVKEAKSVKRQPERTIERKDEFGQISESHRRTEPIETAVAEKPQPIKVGPKIGRNDACPCGSGKKFKQCHGKDLA